MAFKLSKVKVVQDKNRTFIMGVDLMQGCPDKGILPWRLDLSGRIFVPLRRENLPWHVTIPMKVAEPAQYRKEWDDKPWKPSVRNQGGNKPRPEHGRTRHEGRPSGGQRPEGRPKTPGRTFQFEEKGQLSLSTQGLEIPVGILTQLREIAKARDAMRAGEFDKPAYDKLKEKLRDILSQLKVTHGPTVALAMECLWM